MKSSKQQYTLINKIMALFNNMKILETNLERNYFIKHGLHLNSAGKECIALRLSMMVKSCLNKKRMSPIRLKWKDNTTEVPSKTKPSIKLSHHSNVLVPLTIYHQNVRGLRGKTNELLSQLHPNFPHILCFSEHHMNHLEIQQTFIDNYKLGGIVELYMKREEYAYLCKKV